jgi:predicted transcriptional regulator
VGDITIRMDAETRARLDALAKRRGLSTGAMLRALGLADADRAEAAERLRAELARLEPDEEGAAELAALRRAGRRR